jgi:hypothetical protein
MNFVLEISINWVDWYYKTFDIIKNTDCKVSIRRNYQLFEEVFVSNIQLNAVIYYNISFYQQIIGQRNGTAKKQ